MKSASEKRLELIEELLILRGKKELDPFMDKLFEAVSGEFRETVITSTDPKARRQGLDRMISFFSNREEYEKCAELQKMVNDL